MMSSTSGAQRTLFLLKCLYACENKYTVPMKILGIFSSREKAEETAKEVLEECRKRRMFNYLCGFSRYDDHSNDGQENNCMWPCNFVSEPDNYDDNPEYYDCWEGDECDLCNSWIRCHRYLEKYEEEMISNGFSEVENRNFETPIHLCIQEIEC